jgi:carboxymethylenebutenolidase
MEEKVEVKGNRIEYQSGNHRIKAYVASPRSGNGKLPAVIVVHEIFGLDAHIEDVARRFAAQGYLALAPDLYSKPGMPVTPQEIEKGMGFMMSLPPSEMRNQKYVSDKISELPKEEREVVGKTMKWLTGRNLDEHIPDLKAGFEWLLKNASVDKSRIFAVGFCMGGTLVGKLAAEGTELAGASIFYGENPAAEKISMIKCPVLGIYGGEDHRITDKVPELEKLMKENGKSFRYRVFPGAYHAFFNDTRKMYNKEAAAEAWKEVLGFFGNGREG